MYTDITTDIKIPMVGYGTYLVKEEEAPQLVAQAIRLGYRHIDTAEAYNNEHGVGLGIKAGLQEQGLAREELFVTTKLWPGNKAWGQPLKTYETTIETLNSSLAKLQLDYIDLYLIHAPFTGKNRLQQWKALIELRKQGKVRTIGVSNFGIKHIEEIKEAALALPDANQIELHPWTQKTELVAYLAENSILPIAYSSMVPLSSWRAAKGQKSGKTEEMKAEGTADDTPFKTMAAKYGVTEAQVLLRWGVQKGYPVLPKSVKEERMRQNIDLFSFEIDAKDMVAIEQLDRGDGVAWTVGEPTRMD